MWKALLESNFFFKFVGELLVWYTDTPLGGTEQTDVKAIIHSIINNRKAV